ncbi:hypothetical protein PENTCL1PPCAC_10481, partial [Pristionchus entomophagus]
EIDDLKWDLEKMGENIRKMVGDKKELNETVTDLNKILLDAEHSREEQLWMKNEEIHKMKMALEEKEVENESLRTEVQKLRETVMTKVKTEQGIVEKTLQKVEPETTSRFVDVNKKGSEYLRVCVNITDDHSLIVYNIVPGGPADLAGMKAGDEILSVNGTENRKEGSG